MKKLFTKKQILTIPNLLSLIRLLLIPLIIWLYCVKCEYYLTIIVILLSGLTDIVDGFIARKFNQVTDLGKILDPISDKLTQGALIICLLTRYKLMILLIIAFIVKETLMSVLGLIIMKKDNSVNSAKWHGKLATMYLYLSLCILILFPSLPITIVNILIIIGFILIINSLVLYLLFYIRILKKIKINKNK